MRDYGTILIHNNVERIEICEFNAKFRRFTGPAAALVNGAAENNNAV
jgi:hypothetical protein